MRAFHFEGSMTQVPSPVLQALTEILAAQSPQFAARLKQRLTATLQAKEEPPFDERKLGFKGFRDFLERGTQGLFLVTPSDVGPDVMVSLVGAQSEAASPAQTTGGAGHSVRNDVWQAFINPDPARVRFWGRDTHQVRHYLHGEDSPHAREVQDSAADYIEIEPVSAATQLSWMRQFVYEHSHAVPETRTQTIHSILDKPYSSGINAAFTGALGASLGGQWRHQRIKNVVAAIYAWADKHNVPHELLNVRSSSDSAAGQSTSGTEKAVRADGPVGPSGIQDPRERAVRLLDMLSNDEISRIVVPILLSTLLVKEKS